MSADEHNKYISWLFLANGLFQAGMLALALGILILIFAVTPPDDDIPAALLAAIFSIVFAINAAFISPNFIAYYGLKNRKPWARVASIVAGILSAMNIPVGTAACAYSMWFFFGEEWKLVYPDVAGRGPNPQQLGYGGQQQWEGRYVREDGEIIYQPSTPPDWR